MMFTEKAMKAAEEKFSRLLEKAGEKKREEILSRLAQAEKMESADVIDLCQQPFKRPGQLRF